MPTSKSVVLATPYARYCALHAQLQNWLGADVPCIKSEEQFTVDNLRRFSPRYVFLPHWPWRVPEEVYREFECVIFHMTDVPFGRGGSPLQNLIALGIYETKLTALRCAKELDAGPVYLKRPLSLYGSAEEILMRAAVLIGGMIQEIVEKEPIPTPQCGEPTLFRRRKPEDGNIAALSDIEKAFDYIRMLDAEGYPRAFLETGHFRLEFSRASLSSDSIHADVRISRKKT